MDDREAMIERELDLRLVLSPDDGATVPARLRYRTDDPFAVHVSFHIHSDAPVHWTFARELLIEGLFRPCGRGDVRVWPTRADGRQVVCLALSSPDGDALLEAPAHVVSAWMERTLRAVPTGSEAERLGLEQGLEALLSPES
ncbi:SsgA family sporulation/cell division regulator [Streptomyces sp. RKND-216]|uniref:SsgA family sporulation/cell division regulator n=1 Tax=Streptomyces sp. RKND-216 TaxID=2562581 RepID=UPI001B347B2A|nr:SsgA family sporulation/cell division regulator [Streptomyces sp. RKND-216]